MASQYERPWLKGNRDLSTYRQCLIKLNMSSGYNELGCFDDLGIFYATKHLFVLIHKRNKGEVKTVQHV